MAGRPCGRGQTFPARASGASQPHAGPAEHFGFEPYEPRARAPPSGRANTHPKRNQRRPAGPPPPPTTSVCTHDYCNHGVERAAAPVATREGATTRASPWPDGNDESSTVEVGKVEPHCSRNRSKNAAYAAATKPVTHPRKGCQSRPHGLPPIPGRVAIADHTACHPPPEGLPTSVNKHTTLLYRGLHDWRPPWP